MMAAVPTSGTDCTKSGGPKHGPGQERFISSIIEQAATTLSLAGQAKLQHSRRNRSGHAPSQRVTVGGKRNVSISGLEPVGGYAVRIRFSDGHDTGLFTWPYLEELGRERDARWAAYLAELSAKGMSRD